MFEKGRRDGPEENVNWTGMCQTNASHPSSTNYYTKNELRLVKNSKPSSQEHSSSLWLSVLQILKCSCAADLQTVMEMRFTKKR
jgi:hypothetical protein